MQSLSKLFKNSLIWIVTDLPELFKQAMERRLGPEAPAFFHSLQEKPPVSIRYNLLKNSPASATPVPWCGSGRYLESRPSFTLDPTFHAGGYYVQEASSMLLEQAVLQSVPVHSPVVALDLCAAPGGKSTHLLNLLSRESLLISNEVIQSRGTILGENLEKWGSDNVIITQNDPADFARLPEFMDLVLIDAPCSGEGLFRKDPEAAKEWSPRAAEHCCLRQRRIVADAWTALKPGGVLIYSTCTYNEDENLGNLHWINQEYHPEFIPIQLDSSWGVLTLDAPGILGYQCYPHRVRGEGFFFSAMRKPGVPSGKRIRVRDTLTVPRSGEMQQVKNWVDEPEKMFFFLKGQQVRMLPSDHRTHLAAVLENLRIVQAGTALGDVMKNKIVPNSALALSIRRNKETLEGIALTLDESLAYLRKDSIPLNHEAGFHVVEYKGLGLGWVNILPGRVNNLYPSSWRIRMNK